MGDFMENDMQEALQALNSMINRSENAWGKFTPGNSQHTLLKNRIKALYIAVALITQELAENDAAVGFSKDDLEDAVKPINSLISKSEKAQKKLVPGTWQHKMLADNLKALRMASKLLAVYAE